MEPALRERRASPPQSPPLTRAPLDRRIEALEATLELSPGDEQAFGALAALHEERGRWDELIALHERRARLSGDAGAGALLARAAELARRRQKNPARAEALYRQALHADPGHAGALTALVELCEERGDPSALAEALERQADCTPDLAEAARLYARLGRLFEERLVRRDRASLFYARACRLHPELDEARAAALRCQLSLRRWRAALQTLDAARRRGVAPAALAAQYARLGVVLLDEPLDHALAAEAFRAALALDPAAPRAREALARLETLPARFAAEAQALAEQADRTADRRTAAQLLLRAAGLRAAHDPGHPELAIELAERAVLQSRGSAQGQDLLERLLGGRGASALFAEVLTRLSRALEDRGARTALHLRLARLHLEASGNAAAALEELSLALKVDPACEPAAEQAFELLIEAGRPADALTAMERHLAAAPSRPQHAAWRIEAARLAVEQGDVPRARALLEAARRADPRSPRIAQAVAPLLRAAEEWRPLADALDTQVQSESDEGRRAQLLEELAEVHLERLGAPRDAFRRLAQALRLAPGRSSLRRALDAAAARAGLFEELARVYDSAAHAAGADLVSRKLLLRRAAEVWDRDLGQPERALEAWRKLVAVDPGDGGARALLEAALLRAGHLAEAARELRQRAEATADDTERREILSRLARGLSEAGDHEGAADAWREVLLGGGGSEEALRALASSLALLGPDAAEERLNVLTRLACETPAADRAQVELERAALLEAPLGQLGAAADTLLGVLRDGSPEEALESAAGLGRLLARDVEPARLASALAPFWAARGEHARQADLLELLAARQPGDETGEVRARHLLEASEVREERLGDPRAALTSAAGALRAWPASPAALERCIRLAGGVGAHAELLELLGEVASKLASSPAAERVVRLVAAEVAERDLGRPEEAGSQLRRAAELDPSDAAVLESLTRVTLAAGRYGEAAELLQRRMERAEGPVRHALALELAALRAEKLGDAAAALHLLRELLAARPADEEARAVLERLASPSGASSREEAREASALLVRLAEARGEPRVLLDALERHAAFASAAEAAAIERRAATLYGSSLGQWPQAVAALKRAVRADPSDPEGRRELGLAAERAGEDALREVASLYGELLPSLSGDAALTAWRELARLREERLADVEGALAAWSEVRRLGGEDAESAAALARLHRAAGHVRERGEALLALAASAAGPHREAQQIAALSEAAEVLELAGNPAAAAGAWQAVVALGPDHPVAGAALERLLGALDRPEALAGLLAARRERLAAGRDAALSFRLAELYRTRLGSPEEALPLLDEVLAAERNHGGARAALAALALLPGEAGRRAMGLLDALLGEEGQHAARVHLREQRLAAEVELEERLRLHAEVRELHERALGRPELALDAAARAFLEGGRAAAEAEPELVRLAALTGREERLAEAYEAAADGEGNPAAEELLRRAARVRSRLSGAPGAAIASWEAVLRLAPDDGEALDALLGLHAGEGDAAALEAVGRRRAALDAEAPGRAARLAELGEILEALRDLPRAESAAEAALGEEPGCAPAFALLERLFRANGDDDALARLLGREAEAARDDGPRRLDLLVLRAELLERSGPGEEALDAWATVLTEQRLEARALAGLDRLWARPDTCAAAGRLLEDVYRARGDARGLLGLLRARAEAAGPAERGPLLAEVAVLNERLGEYPEAFTARAEELAALPPGADDPALRADLRRLASAAGAEARLAEAYAAALERGLPPAARREVLRELGSLHDETGEPERAALALEALASEAQTEGTPDREAFAALARLHRRRGAPRPLSNALSRLAELTPAPEAQAELWLEVATIMEEQLADREGAAEAYRKILAVMPEDPNALRLLARLLGAAERWDELVEVLAREAEAAEGRGLAAEAAELRCREGQLRCTRLDDPRGAVACWRAVLARVPRHPAALAGLGELARGGGSGAAEAALLLEPILEAEGEYGKLVEALLARATAEADPARRAPLLRKVAEVQAGPMRSPELAFLSAARAVREDPDQPESIALAARLAEAEHLEEELAALLAEVSDRSRDPSARLELRRRAAGLSGRAGGARQAAAAWTRVLELAPLDREALDGLARAQRELGDAEGLASTLRRRMAVEDDPPARAGLLTELAAVQEEELHDPAAALQSARQALELDPSRREALARLDRLCAATERWAELAEVLAREVAAAADAGAKEELAELRRRLAELRETRLLDREGAIALYEELLTERSDDALALSRLEALLARDPGRGRAAEVLERAYAAAGAWPQYAAVLEVRANERPDPVERKALFLELAEVREARLGSPELAFTALSRAFREDPADAPLRAKLSRLAALAGLGEELAALLEEELPRVPSAESAEVALALGELHAGSPGGGDAAASWYRRAWKGDARLAPKALPALDRLYRASNRSGELAEVLEAEASLAAGADRASLLFRLGQLHEEKLGNAEGAARSYEALLAEEPAHGAALRALELLYEAAGRGEALAENLARQRELAEDGAVRQRLGARLAVTVQGLGRDDEAIELWREVLGHDPHHEVALASLERLLERRERWGELAELLRARIALTSDRREAARLQGKLGELLAAKLGDTAGAVRAFGAVLDADPRNRRALEALRDLHQAAGDLDGLASALRRLVPLQEDAAGVKAVRVRLAGVLLEAGKRGEAAEQGRRALELGPHGEAELARLADLFEAADAPLERVKALEARGAQLSAGGRNTEAVEALTVAADLWEKVLGRPEGAASALEKVLAVEPGRREAWDRLRALHARAGDWRAYVRVCELFVSELPERSEQVALLGQLVEVHEKRLGQREMAFITACRAFALDPSDPAASAAVARLAEEAEAWEELAGVYEQVSEESAGAARARLLVELGKLRDEHLDDLPGAESALRRALEADPSNPAALDALTALFTRRGRVRDLVIALEQKLEAAAGLEEKRATLLEMARIYDAELHDPGEAISCLTRLLELDGADAEALAVLAALHRREGRWAELAAILARARDLAADEASRLACQLQIASLQENELSDDEAAVSAYRAVLATDDAHREALDGLERLYTKLDRFAELNRVYERQSEIATDPREKVRILGKSASIWEEKLGDAQQAILRHEAVLALEGGNLAALKSLESLYRREGHWEKLITVLQHDASLCADRREQVALLVQSGEVWWKELARVDRAEALFSQALSLDPEARVAVSALGRLYERSGNWNLAVEMLTRETRLAGSGPELVELHARVGRIEEEMLQDRAAAKVAYARALDLDPGHLPSLRALRAIAGRERDREAYLRLLLADARYAESDLEKARLLHEAGRIHQEERDDAEGAVRLYAQSLERVPDFLPAAQPLADLLVARGDWRRAEATLDVVVRLLAQEGDAKELCRQAYRLGYVAEKLGNREKALSSFRRAYELDATYLPALEGLGHLLVEDELWDEALRVFLAILIHHRDGLTDLEVVETYWQIGQIQARLSQGDRAAKSFEKALEIDSGHEPSRRALVEVLEAAGELEAAVEHRQRLLPSLEGAERVAMLVSIGLACRDRLHDPYQAIDAFAAAARLDPGDAQITEALLGLYRETKQAQKAADVIARLASSPEAAADGARRARLRHALAHLLRDELSDEAGAARELEAALDADPGYVKAFADLERLLTRGGRWRELAAAYTRMIARLPKGPEARPGAPRAVEGAGRAPPAQARRRGGRAGGLRGGGEGLPRRRAGGRRLRRALRRLARPRIRGRRGLPAPPRLGRGAAARALRAGEAPRFPARLRRGVSRRPGARLPGGRGQRRGGAGGDPAPALRARRGAGDDRTRRLGRARARAHAGPDGRHPHLALRRGRRALRAGAQGSRPQPAQGRGGRGGLDALPRQHGEAGGRRALPARAETLPPRRGGGAAPGPPSGVPGTPRRRGAVPGAAAQGAPLHGGEGCGLPPAGARALAAHAARPARGGVPGRGEPRHLALRRHRGAGAGGEAPLAAGAHASRGDADTAPQAPRPRLLRRAAPGRRPRLPRRCRAHLQPGRRAHGWRSGGGAALRGGSGRRLEAQGGGAPARPRRLRRVRGVRAAAGAAGAGGGGPFVREGQPRASPTCGTPDPQRRP